MTTPTDMTPGEFRDILDDLGISQTRFAELAGINERTARRYATGKLPVTKVIKLALLGLLHPSMRKDLHKGTA